MIILGISCYFHDSAACIMKDGEIVAAAAEERFTRIKHDNTFPFQAIQFCLDAAKIAINEVEYITFYEKPLLKFDRILSQHLQCFPQNYKLFMSSMGNWVNQKTQIKKTLQTELKYFGKVLYIPHHLSHAASAYYLSGFSESAIVTIDGVGEWATTTVGYGKGKKITLQKEVDFPHSLGLLYSTVTTYLGFSANDAEYKVMGLAAYGNPKPFRKHFDQLMQVFPDGSYRLNMKYFDFDKSDHMPSKKFAQLFGHPAREPESKTKRYHENIAAALQEKLEEVVFSILNYAYAETKSPHVCLAGGVALNSVMNGKILKNTPFTDVFIPPDPSDAGGAMGAALWTWYNIGSGKKKPLTAMQKNAQAFSPYLGPQYAWYEIEAVLKKYNLSFTLYKDRNRLLDKVVNLIIKQKVIGWFQGRMEWGPRALGSRSILASARKEEMKDIINARVKHRELFRPFAPVILEEHTNAYFEADRNLSRSAKWMLMVYPFKEKMKKKLPAVVHVDGTGRLQTVARRDNQMYYDLLKKYYQKTKVASFINTSFNVRGEPIVCTPEDAVKCFLHTDIDFLVIDNYLVKK